MLKKKNTAIVVYRIFSIKPRVSNKRRISKVNLTIGPSGIYLRYYKL